MVRDGEHDFASLLSSEHLSNLLRMRAQSMKRRCAWRRRRHSSSAICCEWTEQNGFSSSQSTIDTVVWPSCCCANSGAAYRNGTGNKRAMWQNGRPISRTLLEGREGLGNIWRGKRKIHLPAVNKLFACQSALSWKATNVKHRIIRRHRIFV